MYDTSSGFRCQLIGRNGASSLAAAIDASKNSMQLGSTAATGTPADAPCFSKTTASRSDRSSSSVNDSTRSPRISAGLSRRARPSGAAPGTGARVLMGAALLASLRCSLVGGEYPDTSVRKGGRRMHLEDLILVSVDDHVVEPPNLFDNHLP